ncbi:hypothetical protein GCM10009792_07560 [Microcella alkalica]|uniref:Uncharacterized protein n=1 Tax=Microcella alkalica TaxID=355930 RepID=A0A839EAW7_9MICO|nr:hypothetical protein [Microcella alkalica]
MNAEAQDAPAAARPRFGASRVAVTIALGLLAAWFLFDGVSNLLALPQQLRALGLADRTPWPVLAASVLAPPVIFALGLVVGRRQTLTRFTLVLIVALATIATTRLSLVAAASAIVTG